MNEQGTENEELWNERILKNVYRKRPSIVGETEDEVNKPKKKSKKDVLDENVGKADTNKEFRSMLLNRRPHSSFNPMWNKATSDKLLP